MQTYQRTVMKIVKLTLQQNEAQKNILNFLRSKGYDDALTYGGGSTSSQNTFWLVLYLLSTTYTLGAVILIYWYGYS